MNIAFEVKRRHGTTGIIEVVRIITLQLHMGTKHLCLQNVYANMLHTFGTFYSVSIYNTYIK